MKRLFIFLILMHINLYALSTTWDLSNYHDKSKEALLEITWNSESLSEKNYIRSYLAYTYPNSAEGCFSSAWLMEGKEKLNKERSCRQQYPSFIPVLANSFISESNIDTKIEIAKKIVQLDPEFDSFYPFRLYYEALHKKNKQTADMMALEYAKVYPDTYIFDFVQALWYEDEDPKKAQRLYQKALTKKDATVECLNDYTGLRLEKLSGNTMQDKIDVLIETISYYKYEFTRDHDLKKSEQAKFWSYMAKKIEKYVGIGKDSLSLYQRAWQLNPTAELLGNLTTPRYVSYFPNEIKAIVNEGEKTLMDTPQKWEALAAYFFSIGNSKRVMSAANNTIKYSHSAKDEEYSYSSVCFYARKIYLYDKAIETAKKKLSIYPDGSKECLFNSYVETGRYEEAKQVIDTMDTVSFRTRMDFNSYYTQLKDREKFYQDHPFLKAWELKFGDSLKVQIEFEVGSAKIKQGYYSELNKLSDAMQMPGADEYIFMIEGHTDSSGNDEYNLKLSKLRADAIKHYLVTKKNIPEEKIKTVGYGERYPIASNQTTEGKKRNRRVELIPYGSYSKPTLMVPPRLRLSDVAFSKDSRYFITYLSNSNQMIDTHTWTKKHTFTRASSPKISPNGRYVAGKAQWVNEDATETNKFSVYDIKTGLLEAQLKTDGKVYGFDWSPTSSEIVFAEGSSIKIFDMKEKHITRSVVPNKSYLTTSAIWSKDGEFIYTTYAGGKSILIYDAKTLTLVKEVGGVDWVHKMSMSPNGKYLVALDNYLDIVVYDTDNWQHTKNVKGKSRWASFSFHPEKNQMIYNDTVYSLPAMRPLYTFTNDAPKYYTPDGVYIYEQDKNSIKRYDANSYKFIDKIENKVSVAKKIYVFDDKYILESGDDFLHVIDIQNGKRIHSWNEGFTLTGGGPYLYKESTLYWADLENFSIKPLKSFRYKVDKYLQKGKYFVTLEKNGEAAKEGTIHCYDLGNMDEIFTHKVQFISEPVSYRVGYTGLTWDIDPVNNILVYNTQWNNSKLTDAKPGSSKSIHVLSLQNGKEKYTIDRDYYKENVNIRRKAIAVTAKYGKVYLYDSSSGKYIKESTSGESIASKSIIKGEYSIYSNEVNYAIIKQDVQERLIHFDDNLQSIDISVKNNLLLALLNTGELEFYDLKSLKKELTILNKKDNEWIAYTPTGYYDASINGTDGSYWSLGEDFVPFETFSEAFYQPKLIKEKLTAIRKQDVKRLEDIKEVVDIDVKDVVKTPYKLKILSPKDGETKEDTYKLQVLLNQLATKVEEAAIEINVNGRNFKNTRGFRIVKKEVKKCDNGAIDCQKFTYNIPLEEGRNIIQVGVRYKKSLLDIKHLVINKKQLSQSLVQSQQHLWYFGVGVSKYKNPNHNLDYADKDALAIEKLLKAQEGKLFKKVHTQVLTNADVTEKAIKIAMNRFFKQASAQDTIILFTAGHGVRDNDGTLYFMTHDSNLEEPYTGMDVSFLRDFLNKRPSTQKALYWMDICHAGSIGSEWGRTRGRMNSNEAVKMLAQGTGISIMASSTGMESSLEGVQYKNGHGAFSAAILDGLEGEADMVAGNKDGVMTVLELQNYVSRRVPEITNGQQHPMIPIQVRLNDYPIALSN